MKKVFLAIFAGLLLIPASVLSAQTTEREPHSVIHVSFFPPLSTNGKHAGLYTNDFSLNLLVGVSKNERTVALAGLANIIRNDATGVQFAGLANYAGGEGRGGQFAGFSNIVRSRYEGVQFAGLANYTGGEGKGAQFAGLANIVGNEFEGVQFAGLANVVRNDFTGVQFAGLSNIVRSEFKGIQIAGLFNRAGDVDGIQFAGLFNMARDVDGVQFAGLVNIADHSDYPIGLVNIIRDGEMGIAVGYNELGTASLTFRSGGRVLYGILGMGYNHKTERRKAATITGGYGAHINVTDWLRINNEITVESFGIFSGETTTFKSGYALLPAFRMGHFEIFGGPSINYMHSREANMFSLFPNNSLWKKESARKLQQLYIGWQVGVQVIF